MWDFLFGAAMASAVWWFFHLIQRDELREARSIQEVWRLAARDASRDCDAANRDLARCRRRLDMVSNAMKEKP